MSNEGRDGCGRRAGGALPQERQQDGEDGGAGTARHPETGDPYGLGLSSGQRDGGRGGLRDQERRDARRSELCNPERQDARRFGSVSGTSADADVALSATRRDTPRPVALRSWWIEPDGVRGPRTGNRERLVANEARRASNGALSSECTSMLAAVSSGGNPSRARGARFDDLGRRHPGSFSQVAWGSCRLDSSCRNTE